MRRLFLCFFEVPNDLLVSARVLLQVLSKPRFLLCSCKSANSQVSIFVNYLSEKKQAPIYSVCERWELVIVMPSKMVGKCLKLFLVGCLADLWYYLLILLPALDVEFVELHGAESVDEGRCQTCVGDEWYVEVDGCTANLISVAQFAR